MANTKIRKEQLQNFISEATQAALDTKLTTPTEINEQTGIAYTFVIEDNRTPVIISNADANTVTVPPNDSVAFPVASILFVVQGGVGSTTIAAGAGVTINNPASVPLEINEQEGSRALLKYGINSWKLI